MRPKKQNIQERVSRLQLLLDFHLLLQQEARKQHLAKLNQRQEAIIILETPYRRDALLEEVTTLKREVFLAFEIGKPNERYLVGSPQNVKTKAQKLPKGNFVLILAPKI